MAQNARTIAQFVDDAFPYSTIPLDNEQAFSDFSFNLVHFDDSTNGDPICPDAAGRKEPFPLWPADMFAVTAALLERSAAYQRLADVIHSREQAVIDIDWRCAVVPSTAGENDPFGVRLPHRPLLRLIGALWSQGALFVSGLHEGQQIVGMDKVVERMEKRARAALEFMHLRQSREIADKMIVQIEWAIYNFVINSLELKDGAQIREDVIIIPNQASRLALTRIFDHHQRFISNTPPQHDYQNHYANDEQFKRLHPACLVLWANHYLQFHWDILRSCQRPISPAISDGQSDQPDLAWWRAAMRLMIVADEAGKSMGFSLPSALVLPSTSQTPLPEFDAAHPPQLGLDCRTIWEHYQSALDKRLLGRGAASLRFARTLTRCFEEDFGSVLPKAHVPANGCTIRSLSHNFALLPPKGRVRARWARQPGPKDRTTYNILIIPYPYRIKSRFVMPIDPEREDVDWGFFSIEAGWIYDGDQPAETPADRAECRKAVWNFISSLMDEQADGSIDAVVLPEAALDWETFTVVQENILAHCPYIELLVCGLTSAPGPAGEPPLRGNFVATYMRNAKSVDDAGRPIWAMFHHRPKHHRWKLDAGQLGRYALANRLRPDRLWWENIPLPPREMLFAEFAPGSIVTTLICEDLARIEPCQVALRSVGPNLVLVLLMDSAQTTTRWPYQYAGVLTDDPGSSVLTLTSFGLIHRSNLSEDWSSREIALWREPQSGAPRQITLPKGYHAQLLSIRKEYSLERTLDGRDDNEDSAIIWKFAGLVPVKGSRPPGGGPDD